MSLLDIRGLNKVELLERLVARQGVWGASALEFMRKSFGRELAAGLLRNRKNKQTERERVLEHFAGCPIHADLTGDYLDPQAYDYYAGQGAASGVVEEMRKVKRFTASCACVSAAPATGRRSGRPLRRACGGGGCGAARATSAACW